MSMKCARLLQFAPSRFIAALDVITKSVLALCMWWYGLLTRRKREPKIGDIGTPCAGLIVLPAVRPENGLESLRVRKLARPTRSGRRQHLSGG